MQKRSLAEILTGAVVLVVAIAFMAYAVTGSGRALTTGGLTLTARFDRIDGLAPGADIRVAGVKVGQVTASASTPQTFLAVLTLQRRRVTAPADRHLGRDPERGAARRQVHRAGAGRCGTVC